MRTVDPRPTSGPVRSCIGCRRRRPSNALVRLTVDHGDDGGDRGDGDAGGVVVTVGGPSAGRGAWLCCANEAEPGLVDATCLDRALRSRAFARSWRRGQDPWLEAAIRAAVGSVCGPSDAGVGDR